MIAKTLVVFLLSLLGAEADSPCAGSPDPVACGRAVLLRGQSHIGIPAACFARVDAGPCAQDLIRIYYDSRTYTCKAFSYSGCGGNANRFVSVKNCYKLCHPYYRQRFVSLGSDSGAPSPPLPAFSKKSSDDPDSEESAALERSRATSTTTTTTEGATETTEASTTAAAASTTPEATTTTTEAAEAEAAAADKPKDGPPPGLKFFSSADGVGEMEVERETADAFVPQQNALRNIGHESYAPLGGFVPTKDGFRDQVVRKGQMFHTKY